MLSRVLNYFQAFAESVVFFNIPGLTFVTPGYTHVILVDEINVSFNSWNKFSYSLGCLPFTQDFGNYDGKFLMEGLN